MSTKDFKQFVGNREREAMGRAAAAGGVPIIGQRLPEPQVRDALGRVLVEGDFILLQTPNGQPFRIQKITEGPAPAPGAPPMMQITLSSTTHFLSYRDVPNQEFIRVMEDAEVKARQAQGQERVEADRPDAKPVAEVVDEDPNPETLGDA